MKSIFSQTSLIERGHFSLAGNTKASGSHQVVDLFCGCGGLSTGFEHYGRQVKSFVVKGGVDLNAIALETYKHNLKAPGIECDLEEIAKRKSSVQKLAVSLGVDPSGPLVLIGGPPCQGFSAHRKKQGDSTDFRNSLVTAFAKIAVILKPSFIVFENVPEVLSAKHWHLFEELRSYLEKAGYIVRAQVHNLASFGVPQERFRALVIASRSPFSMPRPVLDRHSYRTVKDAIFGLPVVNPGERSEDPMHFCASHKASTIEVIRAVPANGGSRPDGVGPRCLQNVDGFRDVYGRMYWNRPANTITANSRNPAGGRFVHPKQHRGLTVREAALLQGFPKDFEFIGSFDEKFRQIGNAVPPLFATAIASCIWDNLTAARKTFSPEEFESDITQPLSNSFSSGIAGRKNYR